MTPSLCLSALRASYEFGGVLWFFLYLHEIISGVLKDWQLADLFILSSQCSVWGHDVVVDLVVLGWWLAC